MATAAASLFGSPAVLESVKLTADGGVVKHILVRGAGATPAKGDELRCHYVGKLDNGSTFDSSRAKNRPFVFRVGIGQVISAWDMGMITMAKGERAILTATGPYAYGSAGAGGVIPPNATLHFDVEVLSFGEDKEAAGGCKVL